MNLSFTPRPFYPDEQRLLRALKTKKEKERGGKIEFYYFLLAALLAVGFAYLANLVYTGFLYFLFGTLAVLAVCFIVFTPYEMYKLKKRHRAFLVALNALIDGGIKPLVIDKKAKWQYMVRSGLLEI